MLIPSIDLFDGKAVQWQQGAKPVLEREDVFELLEEFSLYGEVAVIDLNAATGKGDNRELIRQMLKRRPCRVGGGIRNLETAKEYLKMGASRIILGTAAREAWTANLPKSSLIFAIDAKGDELLSHGWQKGQGENPLNLLKDMAERCSEFLYTQVEKEGMLQGLDRLRVKEVVHQSPLPVTIAGGISDLEDLKFLRSIGANAQIGMALYTGRFTLPEAFLAGLKFDQKGLIPTIVQDVHSKDVLMMAYSNQDSLKQAFQSKKGTYFSRSRQSLWVKGETSGNTQELIAAEADCDGDTLLFKIRQSGGACHLQRHSCFPSVSRQFSLADLDTTLQSRAQSSQSEKSYTQKLLSDPALRAEKLREECEEVIEAQTFSEIRWEAADLLYFLLVQARAGDVGLQEIVWELRSRHGNT